MYVEPLSLPDALSLSTLEVLVNTSFLDANDNSKISNIYLHSLNKNQL